VLHIYIYDISNLRVKDIRREILLWTDIGRYGKAIVIPKISVYLPGLRRTSLEVPREIVE
jgi:hypothetical protein